MSLPEIISLRISGEIISTAENEAAEKPNLPGAVVVAEYIGTVSPDPWPAESKLSLKLQGGTEDKLEAAVEELLYPIAVFKLNLG